MPKIIHLDKTKNMPIRIPFWEQSFSQSQDLLFKLPQIISGAVSEKKALFWLEAACKQHTPAVVRRLLDENSTFTTNDIRALWAHDQSEYYPKYEASEVYALKMLNALRVPDSEDHKKHIIDQLFISLVLNKYGLVSANEQDIEHHRIETNNQLPWINSTPFLVAKTLSAADSTSDLMLVDLKINYNHGVTQSDEIRHHYHHLGMANRGINTMHSYQANITIDPAILDTLYLQAKMSLQARDNVVSLLVEMENKNIFSVSKERIALGNDLMGSIVETGQKHYANLLSGVVPTFKKQPTVILSDKQKQDYISAAKSYAVAHRMVKVAEKNLEDVKPLLPRVVQSFGQGVKFEKPYPLARVDAQKQFDLDGAAQFLKKSGVDDSLYTNRSFDVHALVAAAASAGVDAKQFQTGSKPDKTRVISLLEDIGVSGEEFYTASQHTHFTGQSRGSVKELVNEIDLLVEDKLAAVTSEVLHSTQVENPTMHQAPTRSDENQLSIGI